MAEMAISFNSIECDLFRFFNRLKEHRMSIGFGSDLGPKPQHIKAGFDHIFDGIQIDTGLREAVFAEFLAVAQKGSPREEQKLFLRHLAEADWHWPWFDEWRDRFAAANCFPPMWRRFEETWREIHRTVPDDYERAFYLAGWGELREWLKTTEYQPVPMPRSREALLKYMTSFVPFEVFRQFFETREEMDAEDLPYAQAALKEEQIKLLGHTVAGAICRARDVAQFGSWRNENYRPRVSFPDPTKVKALVADPIKALTKGDLSQMPPFYPGCRAGVNFVPVKRRSTRLYPPGPVIIPAKLTPPSPLRPEPAAKTGGFWSWLLDLFGPSDPEGKL